MIQKSASELQAVAYRILRAAGADDQTAVAVAEHLVLADLSGVGTHGVRQLPRYVADIAAGILNPRGKPRIIGEGHAYALVSGGWTFGQIAAEFAADVAVARALARDIAIVALVQAHHIGRLGHFAERAAGRGVILLIWAGGYSEEQPQTAPYGGRSRVLHTNPIALGFPGGPEGALVADIATTAVAGMRVVEASERGQELPAGAIVDRNGYPTTDPADFFGGGSHLPFGGHKGYAIMLAAEWLGRIFSGSDDFAASPMGGPDFGHQGVTMVAVRADLFTPTAKFNRRSDEMVLRLRRALPAPGFERVLVPGDRERESRQRRAEEGIPLEDNVWAAIDATMRSHDGAEAASCDE
jgi:LDH2 family malate/lactate/ureidoglycolate dehydrogenase